MLNNVKNTHQSVLSEDVLAHFGETRNTGGFYSDQVKFSRELDIQTSINQSMTMQQAKQMIQRAFVLGDIRNWFDGEYKNGDEWLRGEGASGGEAEIKFSRELAEKGNDILLAKLPADRLLYTERLLEYAKRDGNIYAERLLQRQIEKAQKTLGKTDEDASAPMPTIYADYMREHNMLDDYEAGRRRAYKVSGGKLEKGSQEWYIQRDLKAQEYYEKVRSTDDINVVADSANMTVEDVKTIKAHIFFNMHIKYDGIYERFDPDYDMAVAWKRLTDGNPIDTDVLLLQHELLESKFEQLYNLTAAEAHSMAKKFFSWDDAVTKKLGEFGEEDDLL